MPANSENSAEATGLVKVNFHANPEERQCQGMFKLPHNCTHSHIGKVMLKILQARLQWYVNRELSDIQVGFRKSRGTRDQIANICWIIEKAREFHKNIYFCFIDCQSLWLCGSQQTGKFLKRCKYQTTWLASWEICIWVKKQQLELDMEQQIGSKLFKGIHQGWIFSPCLFNLYTEYIMWNVGLVEAQAGKKIAERNINNVRY